MTNRNSVQGRSHGDRKKQGKVLLTEVSDRQLRAAGFRKVPRSIARGSFKDFLKWKNGK